MRASVYVAQKMYSFAMHDLIQATTYSRDSKVIAAILARSNEILKRSDEYEQSKKMQEWSKAIQQQKDNEIQSLKQQLVQLQSELTRSRQESSKTIQRIQIKMQKLLDPNVTVNPEDVTSDLCFQPANDLSHEGLVFIPGGLSIDHDF